MDNEITPAATGPVSNFGLSSDSARNPVFGNEQADMVGWQNHPSGKLLFLPTRLAFRAGGVSSDAWNWDHVGAYSWAGGCNTQASGEGSLATGFACVASGLYSVALGTENEASGNLSAVLGGFNKASGAGSFVAGANNLASGEYAGAFGRGTVAASYAEFVVGSYNEQTVESTEAAVSRPRPSDRALVVGIGTDQAHRRDGFVVYKDGSLGLCNLPTPPQQPAGRLYAVAGQLHFDGKPLAPTSEDAGEKSAPQWCFTVATNKVELDLAKHRGADVELALMKPDGGVSSKLLLQNDKQALRFGKFSENRTSNPVGQFSVSMGNDSIASGSASFAAGDGATARGRCSVALGYQAEAGGRNAFAAGANSDDKHSLANGDGSVALAGGRADGKHALAIAMGSAEGEHAIAAGYGSQAKGDFSTAVGRFAVARGYGETVVGNHNTEYNPKETKKYNELDRAFSVGIGYSSFDRPPYYSKNTDGLIVFKNGRVLINNAVGVDGAHTIVKGLAPAQLQVNAQDSDGLTIHTDYSRNTLNLVKAADTSNSTFTSFGYLSASDGTSYREIGTIKADGENTIKLNTSSDARLKNDLGLITGSLNTLMQVKIHEFTWKSNGAADVGVFAQELHEVLPNAVVPGDNGAEVERRWLVDYAKLTPLTVAAVQELHQTITTQQQHIAGLEQQLLSLGEQVQELQAWRRQSNV